MEPSYFFEYQLAKATLRWLVAIKILTPTEAQEIDALNRKSFNVSEIETGLMS